MFYAYSDDIHLLKCAIHPVSESSLSKKCGCDVLRRFIKDGYIRVVDPGFDLYRQESCGEPLLQITDSGIQRLHELQADQRHYLYTFFALIISAVSLLLQFLDFIVK